MITGIAQCRLRLIPHDRQLHMTCLRDGACLYFSLFLSTPNLLRIIGYMARRNQSEIGGNIFRKRPIYVKESLSHLDSGVPSYAPNNSLRMFFFVCSVQT